MEEKHRFSGFIFVACIFIGMGVGLIFNNAGAGLFIGLGVGFVLMAITRGATPIKIGIPRNLPNILLTILGILVIFIGINILLPEEISWRYIIGAIIVIIGILIALSGGITKKHNG